MINKKFLFCLMYASHSLMAMDPLDIGRSMVSVGEERQSVPLACAMKFKVLSERLVESGYVADDHGTRIYGADDMVFPHEEKNALWVINNILNCHATGNPWSVAFASGCYPRIEGQKLKAIPVETLRQIACYTYLWQEDAPKKAGEALLASLIVEEGIVYPPLSDLSHWPQRFGRKYPLVEKDCCATLSQDGVLQWHNHRPLKYRMRLDDYCFDQSENCLLGSFASRYCSADHEDAQALFTKDHVQQFLYDKAVNKVYLNESDERYLSVNFVDGSQVHFKRDFIEGKPVHEGNGIFKTVHSVWEPIMNHSSKQ